MSDKKVTPHQMRKGLQYVQQGPDFMRMLTGQSASSSSSKNPYKKPIGIDAKFQAENQSEDEDETEHDILNEREEERPTVVVLKDSKHLDERQVKNILKNLPPGLSEAEIQRRLAKETETLMAAGQASEEEEAEESDQEPVDANGKILFRRPKGTSSSKGGAKPKTSAAGQKKNFEETLLSEASAKADSIKRKAGSDSTPPKGQPSAPAAKKKKSKSAPKSTALLSFGDDE